MKLSPTQLRVLRYASEGRVTYVPGPTGYVYAEGWPKRGPSKPTLARLVRDGLVDVVDNGFAHAVRVTPKGAALLEEQA